VTELQIPESTVPEYVRDIPLSVFDPDLDFDKLLEKAGKDAFYSRAFRKVSKDILVGVPHIVIGATYRQGYKNKDTGVVGDYVSLEAVVAKSAILDAIPIRSAIKAARKETGLSPDLEVYPNEAVIYNDGGTGVRRSITEVFQGCGIIDVGPARKVGENPLDKPYSLWLDGEDQATTGITAVPNPETGELKPFVYVALHGLRPSTYKNEYTGDDEATTYYY
jgi:hypothetical protein